MSIENRENKFVFVVCGEKKHIDSLHLSLRYLKSFSNIPITIVTDQSRNEIKIDSDNILNIKTPDHLTNHQASIWLKTSLHRILPKNILYCYLDSDVIAVHPKCSNIFKEYLSPVSFAKDDSYLQEFSAYALNCSCLNNQQTDLKRFEESVAAVIKSNNFPPDYSNPNIIKLYGLFDEIKKHPIKNILPILNILLSSVGLKSRIKKDIFLNKKEKAFIIGHEKFNYPSLYLYRKKIQKETSYKFRLLKWNWLKSDGSEFSSGICNHLAEAVNTKFNIKISEQAWQHWNGGVFLFDNSSYDFMESWHTLTNEIFNDPYWKTRDQGTLIANVWKFGLQNHACLPIKYNLLANYKDPTLSAKIKNNQIIATKNHHTISPAFIHVYNGLYRNNWDIWDCIEKIYTSNEKH